MGRREGVRGGWGVTLTLRLRVLGHLLDQMLEHMLGACLPAFRMRSELLIGFAPIYDSKPTTTA